MPDFAQMEGTDTEAAGADTGNSRGTTITASGSTNTKGSYTQLIASTGFDSVGLIVFAVPGSANNAGYLIDIAIGGAGSEQVIIPDYHIEHASNNAQRGDIAYYPLHIPAGTRIAARVACQTASATCFVMILLLAGGFMQPSPVQDVEVYGSASGDSGGTSIDPGGTSNTKGSWVQLTASTGIDLAGLILFLGNGNNTVRTAASWLIDIGIGAGGSEQVIVPNLNAGASAGEDLVRPNAFPFIPMRIPAGTRLAVRAACNINDATDRLFDAIIHGIGA